MDTIRVVIADDQDLITESFKVLLETRAPDITVVALAKDGEEAAEAALRERPDVVLMDVRMPHVDGVQAASIIHESLPSAKVIMLTTFDDDAYVHEAIRAGAAGYLLKDISTEELIHSIRAAVHGAMLVSPSIAQKLLLGEPAAPSPASPAPSDEASTESPGRTDAILNELSKREREILRLLGRGYGNKEIAERLFVAEQTVKNGLSVIYAKLGVDNRREARRFVLRTGLVTIEELLSD